MDICNLLNLLLIEEKIGAARIYKKIDKQKLKKIFGFFNEDINLAIEKLIHGISKNKKSYFKKNYEKNLHYSKELSILKILNL
jgi:hypothetical protein